MRSIQLPLLYRQGNKSSEKFMAISKVTWPLRSRYGICNWFDFRLNEHSQNPISLSIFWFSSLLHRLFSLPLGISKTSVSFRGYSCPCSHPVGRRKISMEDEGNFCFLEALTNVSLILIGSCTYWLKSIIENWKGWWSLLETRILLERGRGKCLLCRQPQVSGVEHLEDTSSRIYFGKWKVRLTSYLMWIN